MGTIYNIRGTSGSGKTTLARAVLEAAEAYVAVTPRSLIEQVYESGRRGPLVYRIARPDRPVLSIVGSYANVSGGADTIRNAARGAIELAEQEREAGDVLVEGLLLSEDQLHTLASYRRGVAWRVFHLTTPLTVCMESILARRAASGRVHDKPLSPKITSTRHRTIARRVSALEAAGIPVEAGTRAACLKWLRAFGLLDADEPRPYGET